MPRRHWRLSLTDFPLLFLYHISYVQSVLLTVEMALGNKWILQQHSQITKYLNHSQAQMTNLQFLCNNLGSCWVFFPELGTGTANCVKRFRARNLGFGGFGWLGFFYTTVKCKKDPLAVCSQTSLRNGGNFTRRKENLQEGHSSPGVLAGCQWNTLSVLDLGFKSTTGNLVHPWGAGAFLPKP